MANEIRGTANSGTLYARIMNPAGLWWNGSSFESYVAANYSTYDVALTRQGSSSVHVANFPSGITSSGTYEYFVHRQSGASPAESDLVINTGKVDWTGTVSISAASGSMTGSDFYDYVLRLGFKRTDKATEFYEAATDAIQEMRRRFMFDEAESEATTTDTISSLGDFKLTLESDFGLLLGVMLEDDDTGTPLTKVSKYRYDELYPSVNVESDRGYPRHFCVYAGQIYIGPIPDNTDYVYRLSYSKRAGTVTSSTTGVPFTNLYRDILADNIQGRLYKGLDDFDKATYFRNSFEDGFLQALRRERINSGVGTFNVVPFGC